MKIDRRHKLAVDVRQAKTASSGLLQRHVLFTTTSTRIARTQEPLFTCIEAFEALHSTENFHLTISSLLLDDIRFSSVATTGHRIRLVEDENITLLLPWTGALDTDDSGGRIVARTDAMLVPTPGPRTTVCSPGYRGLVVQLPLTRLRRLAASNPEDRWLPDGRAPGLVDVTTAEGAVLARFLRHLAVEFDQADTLLASRESSACVAALLTELLGDVWRATAARDQSETRPASLLQVERVEDLIRERSSESLSITALAGEIGVSTRALQLAFHQHRGLRPHQALEAIRLDEAHARLRAATPEETVTSIAFDCGIMHLGRFAARYRMRFGELPQTTLRRRQSRF